MQPKLPAVYSKGSSLNVVYCEYQYTVGDSHVVQPTHDLALKISIARIGKQKCGTDHIYGP